MKTPAAILALLLVIAGAFFLRAWRIEAAPFHADEAVQAAIFQDLLEKGKYAYDPHHYHGPLPHYLNIAWMRAVGYKTLAELDEWQFRVLPVAAGVLLIVAVTLSLWREDRLAAVLAAILAGTSPMLVFFSRFGLHESLFVLCGFVATWAAVSFLQRPGWASAALWGALTALTAAGKETWVFFAVAWLLAAFASGLFKLRLLRYAPAGLGAFLIVVVLLFGGEGFLSFWRSYFVYETDAGHEKPFWYFLSVIGPSFRWCGEPWFWLSLLGLLVFGTRLPAMPMKARFAGLSGLLSLVLFSFVPYKTPWLLMLPLTLCLPAAGWIFAQGDTLRRALTLLAFAALVVWQTLCVWQLNQRQFWDSRIPLVYSPSSYQMPTFRKYLQKANGDRTIAVLGTNYWPLPWYLRGFSQVGYFEEVPANLPPGYSTYLLCDEAMEKTGPVGEERLWGVRTDYLMKSLVTSPGGPGKPR